MDLLQLFLDNLLPVFLAAGAGYLLADRASVDPRPLSQVGFYVFSPCMVFHLIVTSHVGGDDLLRMVLFAASSLLLVGLVAWLLTRPLRLSRLDTAALLLVVMLPNAGNFGLSATWFAFGDEALAHASLFFVTSAILSYTVGVFVASMGRLHLRQALLQLLKVPTVWAVPLAFLLVHLQWNLPRPAARTVQLLSDATIPTFLVILGMQLRRVRLGGRLRLVGLAAGLRLVGGMAAGLLVAHLVGLSGVARQAGVLEAAMPSAVINIILATEYETRPGFVTMVVFATTVLSPLTLTPLMALLGA